MPRRFSYRASMLASRPLIALGLAVMLSLSACTSSQESATGTWVDGSGVRFVSEPERRPAPAVEGETIGGEHLALADLDGPVLVNFWASWCGPCAREAPHLAAIAEEFGTRGLHVVGVAVRDSRVNARSFERDFGITYPSWFDESASIAAAFGGIGPAAMPSTILLDADHRVAARFTGAVTAMQLSPYLVALLDEAV